MLERDFNLPAIPELLKEVNTIRTMQNAWGTQHEKRYA